MKARLVFQKALHVLDRERFTDGERLLREALHKAQEEEDHVTKGGTLCCLGDLLFRLGRLDEAESILDRFESLLRKDDLLDQEAKRVTELLDAIRKIKRTDSPL